MSIFPSIYLIIDEIVSTKLPCKKTDLIKNIQDIFDVIPDRTEARLTTVRKLRSAITELVTICGTLQLDKTYLIWGPRHPSMPLKADKADEL